MKSFYVVYYESGVINSDVYHTDTGKFKNVKVSNNRNNKLYVIVIGESTTSRNMSLYGYNRTTNPLLSRQKDLSVFDNVISPHAGTTASITKSLSLKNFENSSMSFEGSIMQLLNAANYDTYWISNQQPVGFAETDITKIVYANRNKIYLNTEGTEEFNQYDDVIFDQIDSVISEESDTNKVLFIHIQGNHFYYKNRYPDSFNVFKENQKLTVATKQNEFNIINEYDNAVVYNDFIINKIINKVKNKKTESFLLYFSDHGEEVYHTIKFAGHNDDVGTLPMFQIPFLLWRSKNYIEKNNIQIDLERGYMTDDLFHSIADLCAVNNINVDLERSIFSNKFKERKRVILGNKDYDSLLSIENNRKK
ncbi:phosphoethanolamine transferase [Algibacter sp. R77976]|uniref:phosphoethanolamine transferase n=1 Tax=Algibacter sp. R77976 TaxID=3093873 RepID=UPI0037C58AC2